MDSNDCDISVAGAEDDCEKFNWFPEVEMSEPDEDNADHLWSIVGSPPFVDDDRREWLAHPDEHTQVGHSKEKPFIRDAPH